MRILSFDRDLRDDLVVRGLVHSARFGLAECAEAVKQELRAAASFTSPRR